MDASQNTIIDESATGVVDASNVEVSSSLLDGTQQSTLFRGLYNNHYPTLPRMNAFYTPMNNILFSQPPSLLSNQSQADNANETGDTNSNENDTTQPPLTSIEHLLRLLRPTLPGIQRYYPRQYYHDELYSADGEYMPSQGNPDIIQASFDEVSPYKKVCDDEALNNIVRSKWCDVMKDDMVRDISDASGNVVECAITGEEFKDEDIVGRLSCNHIFTYEAIYKWLSEESNVCPLCRAEFTWKEVRNLDADDPTDYDDTSIENNEYEEEEEQKEEEEGGDEGEEGDEDISGNDLLSPSITFQSPFSTLRYRTVVPHSYIQQVMEQGLQQQEEQMLQQALYESMFQSINSDVSGNTDISGN